MLTKYYLCFNVFMYMYMLCMSSTILSQLNSTQLNYLELLLVLLLRSGLPCQHCRPVWGRRRCCRCRRCKCGFKSWKTRRVKELIDVLYACSYLAVYVCMHMYEWRPQVCLDCVCISRTSSAYTYCNPVAISPYI